MTLKPIFDKIIVEQHDADDKIAGTNLYVADSAKEKPKRGTVIAVGEGLLLNDGSVKPIPMKVGDEVVLSAHGGTEVEVKGNKYLVMAANEVLAIIEP